MALRQLKPALQFSQGRSLPWSGASLTNCFAEKADGDKQTDFAIMASPGLILFDDIATGEGRGDAGLHLRPLDGTPRES